MDEFLVKSTKFWRNKPSFYEIDEFSVENTRVLWEIALFVLGPIKMLHTRLLPPLPLDTLLVDLIHSAAWGVRRRCLQYFTQNTTTSSSSTKLDQGCVVSENHAKQQRWTATVTAPLSWQPKRLWLSAAQNRTEHFLHEQACTGDSTGPKGVCCCCRVYFPCFFFCFFFTPFIHSPEWLRCVCRQAARQHAVAASTSLLTTPDPLQFASAAATIVLTLGTVLACITSTLRCCCAQLLWRTRNTEQGKNCFVFGVIRFVRGSWWRRRYWAMTNHSLKYK